MLCLLSLQFISSVSLAQSGGGQGDDSKAAAPSKGQPQGKNDAAKGAKQCEEGDWVCEDSERLQAPVMDYNKNRSRFVEAPAETSDAAQSADGAPPAVVSEVKPTRTGAVDLGVSLSAIVGVEGATSLLGPQAALSLRTQGGIEFPSSRGGTWYGGFFEPSISLAYVRVSVDVPGYCNAISCVGDTTYSQNVGLFGLSGTLGVQWMRLGAMDPVTNLQKGYGFAVGGTVGYLIPLNEGSSSGVTYGPQVSFLLPTYDVAKDSYSALNFSLSMLRIYDSTLFVGGARLSIW